MLIRFSYVDDLQAFINDPNFKHKDFWNGKLLKIQGGHRTELTLK
jgi:hypothetical protein